MKQLSEVVVFVFILFVTGASLTYLGALFVGALQQLPLPTSFIERGYYG